MSVDFAKLNKPGLGSGTFGVKRSSTGVSAQAARNLANSSAASKTSIFSNSRPANFVAGQNVAKQSSRYSYQGARARVNQPFVPRHTSSSVQSGHVHSSYSMPGQSGMDKFMSGMQKGMMGAQFLQMGFNTIGGIVNAFSGESPISQLTQGVSSLSGGLSSASSMGSSLGANTTSLMGANSFNSIQNLEKEVSQNKGQFQANYTNEAAQMKSDIEGILGEAGAAEGLKLVGADNLKVPTPDASINMEDLDSTMNNIDGDIDKLKTFYTNDLGGVKGDISSKKGEITGTIQAKTDKLDSLKAQRGKEGAPATLEADIEKLESEIKELKEQKEQLEKADAAIDQATKKCQEDIDKLNGKKAQLKDIKQFEGAVKDKKYDLAKSQDKQMKDLMKQIDKYAKKGNSEAEIKEIKSQLSKLVADAHAAGTPIMNSKNQSYTNEFMQTIAKAGQSPYV